MPPQFFHLLIGLIYLATLKGAFILFSACYSFVFCYCSVPLAITCACVHKFYCVLSSNVLCAHS